MGCDGALYGGEVYDECGVCGGDGSSCRLISGIVTSSSDNGLKYYEYNMLFVVWKTFLLLCT